MLSQEGLGGVTLGRLANDVGMSKSGVFAHFSSITDVQLALLEHTVRYLQTYVVEPTMREPPGVTRVVALMRNWFGWSQRAGLPGGCPIAAAMFELDDVECPARDTVLKVQADWRRMVGQIVRDAVDMGELRADLDVDQFVWELCGIALVHHVSSRFVREADADTRGETAFRTLLNRSRGQREDTTGS